MAYHVPLTLCSASPASKELYRPNVWLEEQVLRVGDEFLRWLGFPPGPAMGCLEVGGPCEVATGPHVTFSSCLNSPCLSVLICQMSHSSLPP